MIKLIFVLLLAFSLVLQPVFFDDVFGARVFTFGVEDIDFGDNVEPLSGVTVVSWVRVDNAQSSQIAFAKQYAVDGGSPFLSYKIGTGAGQKYQTFMGIQGTAYSITSSRVAVAGDKIHLTDAYDNETITLYEDGVSAGSNTAPSGDISYSDGVLIVANNPTHTSDWVGVVSESAVWSDHLGVTMIEALARGVNPFAMRNDILLFYAPIWGNELPEPDYVGQLSGTVTGGIKADWHGPVELLENYLS